MKTNKEISWRRVEGEGKKVTERHLPFFCFSSPQIYEPRIVRSRCSKKQAGLSQDIFQNWNGAKNRLIREPKSLLLKQQIRILSASMEIM